MSVWKAEKTKEKVTINSKHKSSCGRKQIRASSGLVFGYTHHWVQGLFCYSLLNISFCWTFTGNFHWVSFWKERLH